MKKTAEIRGLEILTDSQQLSVIKLVKSMGEFWSKVSIAWYSDGSKQLIIEDCTGLICPAELPL